MPTRHSAFAATLVIILGACASGSSAPTGQRGVTPAPANTDGMSREQLAEELVEVMTPPGQVERTVQLVMEGTIQQLTAELASVGAADDIGPRLVEAVRGFLIDEVDLEAEIRRVTVPLYLESFNDQQLRELIAFHRTPTGQALIAKQPELVAGTQTALAGVSQQVEEFVFEFMFAEMDAALTEFTAELVRTPVGDRVITVGTTVNGTITMDDPQGPDGAYVQQWGLTLDDGQMVTVDLISDDFDAYLMVVGPSGDLLYEDDDGAGGCNSRVGFTAGEGGEYRLVATTVSPDATGAYDLMAHLFAPAADDSPCTG